MKLIRLAIAIALGWTLLGSAITYGGIWDLRANPHRDVEVTLSSGTIHKGTLSKGWDRRWVLTTPNDVDRVATFSFGDEAIQKMSFSPPEASDSPGLLAHWRTTLPVFLVLLVAVAFCIGSMWPQKK